MGKAVTAKAVSGLNAARYGRLCAWALPKVIETEKELERMSEELETLTFKKNPTAEDRALAKLLERLIQDYDDRIELPELAPHKMIQFLMDQRGLRQADLLAVFGSRSVASDVLAGRREPSKAHIRKLAKFFKVSPELFL